MRKLIQHPAQSPYYFVLGPRFDPGAQAEVFETRLAKPLVSNFGGGRVAGWVAGSLMVTQPPQVWFNQQVRIMGRVGTVAGQIFSQPLIDPTNV